MYIWILLFNEHKWDVSPEQIVIIHKSFNYSNVQSDTFYSSLMEPQMKYTKKQQF